MFNINKHQFNYGDELITLETGKIARQALASVVVTKGIKTILCTITASKKKKDGDFLPLQVMFLEKYYASGKFPGGFFKREAKPSEKSTLTARLIDRPIRPLFDPKFRNEVQLVCTTLSTDTLEDLEMLGLIATSAALSISGLPLSDIMGAAKVGYKKESDEFVLNPSYEYLKDSDLDLVVAGTSSSVLMVESQVNELTEEKMLEALSFGVENYTKLIENIKIFSEQVNAPKFEYEVAEDNVSSIEAQIEANYTNEISQAYDIHQKQERYQQLDKIQAQIDEKLNADKEDEDKIESALQKEAFHNLEKRIVREKLLKEKKRIDGRGLDDIRPIEIEVGLFDNVHGSALFTRGETQAMVFTTLGTNRDYQLNDLIDDNSKDYFLFHYNFPPYSVGEVGMLGTPKRRELGHGNLAKRGVKAMMPTFEEFPYSIRVVSEITESNGSSSMASVCGASLSLMSAGVPIAKPIAGIAMGLVLEQSEYCVLTDILGDEDHLGDMDFKVAGSSDGITALQMDIKVAGISQDIMREALLKAKNARLNILEQMNKVITEPKNELPDAVPKMAKIKIPVAKIREVIGKGGATIQKMSADFEVEIEITDEGYVTIYGKDGEKLNQAKTTIEDMTADVEVGQIFEGKITKLLSHGAFVNLKNGVDGYLNISQIGNEFIKDISAHLKPFQIVKVKVTEVDEGGKVKVSMKDIES